MAMESRAELTAMLSVDQTKNRFRFFVLEVRSTEGGAELHRRWGRIGTRGREDVTAFASIGEARAARAVVVERRERRGYVFVDASDLRGGSLASRCVWEAWLWQTLCHLRASAAASVRAMRAPPAGESSQLALPLAS